MIIGTHFIWKMHWEHKAGDNAHLPLFSLSLKLFLCPSHWYHSKIHHIRGSRAHKFCSSCETYEYILKFKLKYLIPILENLMWTFEGTLWSAVSADDFLISLHIILSTWKSVTDYYILYVSNIYIKYCKSWV